MGQYGEVVQDTVTINFSLEEKIVSDTVKATLHVVLALTEQNASENVRTLLNDALKRVIDVEWEYTRLSRYNDRSGHERVEATASARVPERQAAGIVAKAKEVSKAGLQVTPLPLDYNPTREKTEEVLASLRKRGYQRAQEEADLLNATVGHGGNYEWRVSNVSFGQSYAPNFGNNVRNVRGGAIAASQSLVLESASDAGGGDEGLDLTQKLITQISVMLCRVAFST